VLLAKEEMVPQGMIDKLVEIGRYRGMEMKVKKIPFGGGGEVFCLRADLL
jgi:hypothetical protein